jgi:hypothetical protein
VPDPSVSITEPIGLDEAKLHCKVDVTDDDALLTNAWIPAARLKVETDCERAFAVQGYIGTWGMVATTLPLELRPPPINTVTKVEKLPGDGSANVELTGWRLDAPTALLYPPPEGWPTLPDQIRVTYTSGADDVDGRARAAMLLVIGELYDHRAAIVTIPTMPLPLGYEFLISGLRNSTGVV